MLAASLDPRPARRRSRGDIASEEGTQGRRGFILGDGGAGFRDIRADRDGRRRHGGTGRDAQVVGGEAWGDGVLRVRDAGENRLSFIGRHGSGGLRTRSARSWCWRAARRADKARVTRSGADEQRDGTGEKEEVAVRGGRREERGRRLAVWNGVVVAGVDVGSRATCSIASEASFGVFFELLFCARPCSLAALQPGGLTAWRPSIPVHAQATQPLINQCMLLHQRGGCTPA
jgi:hypothetical protein